MLSGCDLEQKLAKALDRIGKGAAALSEAGATVYNMSSAVQKQGISGLLQPETWKQGVSQYPVKHSVRRIAPVVPYQPEDLDERRAILQVRLEKAMQRQDVVCVQQLSHELDKLESAHCKDLKSFGGSFTAADTVLRSTATVPARRIALPAGAIDHMRADRHLAEQWDTVPLASVHRCYVHLHSLRRSSRSSSAILPIFRATLSQASPWRSLSLQRPRRSLSPRGRPHRSALQRAPW
jgi:hypothetical protein